ncbi:MAG: MFS transporter [Drouetiella hepatica Uher 2000/2452]|uniref:MFS transporter n=1 Tax=Drouetiella hepatica Uher 2000/2452 TaxID=904376 RepID=A0A951USG4_9CYAN|nr:MFS transporter [Drouetiella hepatica Uher 2000/2452]
MQHPLQNVNFRLLWLGQSLILCAAQFWLVALTWLVLQKTGSGTAIGTVLLAAAVPRALLTLVGGAISDRHSVVVMGLRWLQTILRRRLNPPENWTLVTGDMQQPLLAEVRIIVAT